MKSLPIFFGLSLLLLPACRKATPTTAAAPAADDAAKIAKELLTLEQEEKRLQHEIEIERLALEKEQLRLQREALEGRTQELNADFLALEKERTRLAEERTRTAEENARMAEIDKKLAQERARIAAQPRQPLSQGSSFVPQQPLSGANVDYDFSVFHNRLSPHGTWFSVPQYGYVWRPSCWNQNNWRPYTQGHWAYSDCGWTWVSSEPFGWATFHYGRWILLKQTGWCWVPGSTWAPAWVCWRNNSSHIGWAPLPPETLHWNNNDWSTNYGASCGISERAYCFVSTRYFGSSISSHVFSPNDCIRFYSQTNFCGGYQFNNNRIICRAIDYDIACRWIGQTIPRFRCDFDSTLPNGLDPIGYVNQRGDRLRFHAPNVGAPWNSALRPSRIDQRIDNDQPLRSKTFDSAIFTRFERSRDAERFAADKVVDDEISQKVIRRIGLREQIALRRDELTATQVGNGNATAPANDTPQPTIPSKDSGLRGNTREETQQPSAILAETTPNGKQPVAQETAPSDPVENVDPANNAQAAQGGALLGATLGGNQSGSQGGLRDMQREQENRIPQTGNDPITERIIENRERPLRQQQERERELGETAMERARLKKEQQDLENQKAQQDMAAEKEQANEAAKQQNLQQEMQQKSEAEALQQAAMREQEQTALQQQQAEREKLDAAMKEQQETAMREQQESAMKEQQQAALEQQQAEQQKQEAAMKDQQEATAREQQEAARAQQEAAMREQQETAREQQEAAMREQQEAAREQQEAAMREQQEAAREQQEAAAREQQERAREQQEAAMREQQERAREEQQERAREQQEAAMREQQERAREQQEAMREQQERAREEQQERAREQQEAAMREQQERAREQQEAAMREQQERAREQQEAAREQQERARQQNGQ